MSSVTSRNWSSRRSALLPLLAIVVLCVRVIQMDGPDILMDDAFISFRYAVNLSNGWGLVFNPGERVEGYTNFLWTVLLAACHRIGLDIIRASKILALVSAIGIIIILYRWGERVWVTHDQRWFLIVFSVGLYAIMGSQARYVVSGMETLFFTFWVTLGLYLSPLSPFLSGIVFALAGMTRPEGLLYFTLAWGYGIIMPRVPSDSRFRYLISFAGGFLLVYGPYFLWRYSYYGYLLPNTFYAKASGLYWARVQRGWKIFWQLLSWWKIHLILVLSLFTIVPLRRSNSWLLLITMVWATVAYFIFVGGDFIVWFGPRFILPVLPLLLLACAEGLDRLFRLRLLPDWLQTTIRFLLVGYLFFNAGWQSWPDRYFNKEAFSVQMHGWAEMGRWIAADTPAHAAIATDAAGLIPFYSGRYTIDMFGLTDLHIAHLNVPITAQSIVAHEKFDPHYILQRGPDYIVSTWMDAQGNAVSAGLPDVGQRFRETYELIAVAKIRNGPPQDGRWIIVTSVYTPELYQQGYVTGLFRRKDSTPDITSPANPGDF